MDGVSGAASIVALGTAAQYACRGAKIFHKTVSKAGKEVLYGDMEFFASHVSIFCSTMKTTHTLIRDHYDKYGDSSAIEELSKGAILVKLASQSNLLINRLKALRPHLKQSGDALGWLGRVEWVLKRASREELYVAMERVKTSITIVQLEVMYEALKKRFEDPHCVPNKNIFGEIKRELRDVKTQLKLQMRSQRAIIERYESLTRGFFFQTENMEDFELNDIESRVLNIGESMVSESTTAFSSRRSTSGQIFFAHNFPANQRGASGQKIPRHISSNSSPNPPKNTYSHPPRTKPHMSPRSQSPTFEAPNISLQLLSAERIHPNLRPSLESDSGDKTTTPTPNKQLEDDTQNNPYMEVRATENHLRFELDQTREALTGYINESNSPTSAKVNHSFPENIISEHLAVELGLQIQHDEDDDDDDEKEIEFVGSDGNITGMVRGKVGFMWKETSLRRRKVWCLVCEYSPFPLIFGSPFCKRRQHYLGPNSMFGAGPSNQ